jgi:hypothetical protein
MAEHASRHAKARMPACVSFGTGETGLRSEVSRFIVAPWKHPIEPLLVKAPNHGIERQDLFEISFPIPRRIALPSIAGIRGRCTFSLFRHHLARKLPDADRSIRARRDDFAITIE